MRIAALLLLPLALPLPAACEQKAPTAPAPAAVEPVRGATTPSAEPAASVAPAPVDASAPSPAGPTPLVGRAIALPGVTPPASLDYLACDRARGKVWVPVANTGSVDVLDVASSSFTRVDGLASGSRQTGGKTRLLGPSAVSVGDGVVYVGDRFSSEVCPVDAATFKVGACAKVAAPTDGVAYVPSTREVWVTTPRDRAIVVLDASRPDRLKAKTTIHFAGSPEGYAVDDTRARFYTNLEDGNAAVVVDLHTHKVTATWKLDCGDAGPRGVAVDVDRGLVFAACTDRVLVLDGAHDGAILSRLDAGAGIDNIDWLAGARLLYVGAAKAARLTIARVDDQGQATVIATGTSAEGARNPVADAAGNAYLADPRSAGILVFPFAAAASAP